VGGPIILGAFTVLVGGMPQARTMDMAICVGPPSMIALGHFQTLVGMAGGFGGGLSGLTGLLAGAFAAALQALGGGYPRAVADPSDPNGYYTEYAPGVRIRGTPEFQARVVRDLDTIASTEAGRETLARIAGNGHTVTIVETAEGNECDTYTSPDDRFVGGAGTDSVVEYNPGRTSIGDGSEPWMTRPADVGLYHELVHGADAGDAAMDEGETMIDGRNTRRREAQAVGIGPYAGRSGSENDYRSQRGEPPRTYY
jgi:hypothetical protein